MLIPPKVFNVVNFVSKDESRYNLGGVYIHRHTDGQSRATATDGKILCEATWDGDHESDCFPNPDNFNAVKPDGKTEGFILPSETCKALAKWKTSESRTKPVLGNVALDEHATDENYAKFATTDLEAFNVTNQKTIQGTFPDYSVVFPTKATETTFKVDLLRLKQLVDGMIKMLGVTPKSPADHKTALVSLYEKKGEPIILAAKNDEVKLRAMIMPCVDNND